MEGESAQSDIFTTVNISDGSDPIPFVFKIYPDEANRSRLRVWIELSGGVVLDPGEDDPYAITVLDADWFVEEKKIRPPKMLPPDVFCPSFIYNSFHRKKTLDLNQYRISKSLYEEYDANLVLTRKLAWNEMKRIEDPCAVEESSDERAGDIIPEISDEEDADATSTEKCVEETASRATGKSTPKRRVLYTLEEGQIILDYICKHQLHKEVKGNLIWKLMEDKKVLASRTGQSMKEHFRKKILPAVISKKGSCPYTCSAGDKKMLQDARLVNNRGRNIVGGKAQAWQV